MSASCLGNKRGFLQNLLVDKKTKLREKRSDADYVTDCQRRATGKDGELIASLACCEKS